MAQEYKRFKNQTHVKLGDGKEYPIVDILEDLDATSIVCEGWQDRHPDRGWSERFCYPDAVSLTGRIVPRVKNFRDITFEDEQSVDMVGCTVLIAKDRSVNDFWPKWP